MSTPPNRIGGARGPNGSTLDDVRAELQTATALLGQLDTNLAAALAVQTETRALLEKLAGAGAPPEGWLGLPSAVGVPVASAQQYTLLGLTQSQQLELIAQGLEIAAARSELGDIRASTLANLPNITSHTSETAFYVTAMLSRVEEISNALRQNGELPADTSIFRLLASLDTVVGQIRACVCDNPGGGGGFTPTPPANSCGGLPAVWDECSLVLRAQYQGAQDLYAVFFPETLTQDSRWGLQIVHPNDVDPALGLKDRSLQGSLFNVCFAWSFAPSSPLYSIDTAVNAASNSPPYLFYGGYTPPVPQTGTQTEQFDPYIDGVDGYVFQANVSFPHGTVVDGKVWATVTEVQPS